MNYLNLCLQRFLPKISYLSFGINTAEQPITTVEQPILEQPKTAACMYIKTNQIYSTAKQPILEQPKIVVAISEQT